MPIRQGGCAALDGRGIEVEPTRRRVAVETPHGFAGYGIEHAFIGKQVCPIGHFYFECCLKRRCVKPPLARLKISDNLFGLVVFGGISERTFCNICGVAQLALWGV
ncbi:hypothetical protein [Phyllobacterium sp. 0TCS1.6C]|uniref:hypothetical protein n=1 Tax=Phyllobacterium sp. 0TCS1.6C TaxID=2995638 RepID=UPI0022651256|nr:hypothetical protein [Phyllobacterium sp. 0TCS1.6C]